MDSDTCTTCRFYRPHGESKRWGLCRRYPPYPLGDGNRMPDCDANFPEVKATDWCGEYQDE
jgi:hypothetical protein